MYEENGVRVCHGWKTLVPPYKYEQGLVHRRPGINQDCLPLGHPEPLTEPLLGAFERRQEWG